MGRQGSLLGGIAGLVCLVLIAAGFITVVSWQLQSLICGTATDTGGDGSVPVPAGNSASPLSVRVATWNTLHRHGVARVLRGIRSIGTQADVIGLQELDAGTRRLVKKGIADTYAVTQANNAVPILWKRHRYDAVAQGSEKVFGVRRIESGTGGRWIGPKSVQWVELRDRSTGAVFFVINHHLVPDIERRGRPATWRPARLALYRQQMAAMLKLVDRFKGIGPVMVTGDFNVAAKTDAKIKNPTFPYVQGQAHGLYSNWRVIGYPRRGTHGHRLIDYVWATTATVLPVAQTILPKHGSDHSPVVVALTNGRAVASLQQQQTAATAQSVVAARSVAWSMPAGVDATRREQITNLRLIQQAVLDVARPPRLTAGVPVGRVIYLAAVAAVGESDLINVNYGDRAGPDSRGLFQQRTSWGTLAQRMDPAYATKSFLLGRGQHGAGGLLDLKDWNTLPVTITIHRVQNNADPNHYTKFEPRAREIAAQAGVDLDAPATADDALIGGGQTGCMAPAATTSSRAAPKTGSGVCPLDGMSAPGRKNPHDCNQAIAYLQEQMTSGSHAWRRRCLALVAVAYGWDASGIPTAYQAAMIMKSAGQLHSNRENIPRGAIIWWDGRATGNTAGHVAIYDGNGHIYSNDVPITDGRVGQVPWTYPEDQWGHRWLGWSPPYFPNAV